jgi:hypothetical protein
MVDVKPGRATDVDASLGPARCGGRGEVLLETLLAVLTAAISL